MADDTKSFPTQSQRDPSKSYNQLRPTSTRGSGSELDEECYPAGTGIPQAEAGVSLDSAVNKIKGGKS